MPWKDVINSMEMNFIPAGLCLFIAATHKGRMQISCKGIAFIQDQCHTIVAVAGCMQNLSTQSEAGQKAAAFFQVQPDVVILFDLDIGK